MPDTWRLGTGEDRARVAIIGCGGAGCNTLRHVVPPPNAERVAVNDALHPSMAGISRRVILRSDSLHAYALMDEKAVVKMETDEEKGFVSALLDRDFAILMGGLGGRLGGWAMALAGRVARILGDASIALVTVPFTAEGMLRRQAAEVQLGLLARKADGIVAFRNDELLRHYPSLPLAKAFAAMGSIMARPAMALPTVLSRGDIVPLKRHLGRAKEWRFGMGSGQEKHRCFLAVEEAYASPWFTGRHEDIRWAVVLIAQPPDAAFEDEILREVRLRSPQTDLAWAVVPEPTPEDRVVVQVLAGLDSR